MKKIIGVSLFIILGIYLIPPFRITLDNMYTTLIVPLAPSAFNNMIFKSLSLIILVGFVVGIFFRLFRREEPKGLGE